MEMLLSWLSGISLLLGTAALIVGALGLVRLPNLFSRIHAVGMMDTAGVAFITLGMLIHEGFSLISVKLAVVGVFLFFTSPIATHAVAQVAHRSGFSPVTPVKEPRRAQKAAKKAAAKKSAKKAAAKKSAKKAAAKKSAKKAASGAPVEKAATKKAATKKAVAKKAVTDTAAGKKTTDKKTVAKKTAGKKTAGKKTAGKTRAS
jgi:multicomponent Na+:H+ antiporter subunit G